MELLTFTIKAGENKVFQRAGRYFEIIEAAGAINVELTGPSGERSDEMRGAVSGMYAEGPYSAFEIENAAGVAQTVTLLITDGRGGSRRQPGNVRVIDQGADKTKAGTQFYGSASNAAAAGKLSAAGIKAIGKSCIVKRLAIASDVAQQIEVCFVTSNPTAGNWFLTTAFQNKNLGGSSSAAVKWFQQSAGAVWVPATELPGLTALSAPYIAANAGREIVITTPIIVPNGKALLVRAIDTVNTRIQIEADFEE